jgi:hypothetical protein
MTNRLGPVAAARDLGRRGENLICRAKSGRHAADRQRKATIRTPTLKEFRLTGAMYVNMAAPIRSLSERQFTLSWNITGRFRFLTKPNR